MRTTAAAQVNFTNGPRRAAGRSAAIWVAAVLLSGCAEHKLHLRGFNIGPAPAAPAAFIAGAAKEELTPPPGYPNAGHGPPAAVARGYWSRLYARAFYFRGTNGTPVALVSCDLYAISDGLWHAVLDRVNREGLYLPPESLVIAATHTHQGPGGFMTAAGYNVLASPLPGFDETLFHEYVARISAAILRAAHDAGPAQLVLHQGTAPGLQRNRAIVPFFANDQSDVDAVVRSSGVACPAGGEPCPRLQAVDPTLLTVEARNERGPVALLVFYAIHPTAMRHDGPLFSSDLTGRAMERLETTWPVAGFFNGAEGDISPDWKDQRREDVLTLGNRLEQEARRISTAADEPATDLEIRAERKEYPNDWHHQRQNNTPKMAERPIPGAAVFGGAEDGRAGIFYQQKWHGGVVGTKPGCETNNDQGCKVPAIDYPLHDFLRSFGIPAWINKLPIRLQLTKAVSAHSFPPMLPIGIVRFGRWLSLAVLPVEMTTTMALRVRRELQPELGRVAVVGLANEYFSYTTTPEEYTKQQYEGASTLSGPQEGPAIIEMLKDVHACQDGKCRQSHVKRRTYSVGSPPATPFGPRILGRAPNMIDEDLDPFAPERLARSEAQVPRASWQEDRSADWLGRDRRVSIWRLEAGQPILEEDESGWNILTVLESASDRKARGTRTWNALWLVPENVSRDTQFYFRVHVPGKEDLCSEAFTLRSQTARLPERAHPVDRACPPS